MTNEPKAPTTRQSTGAHRSSGDKDEDKGTDQDQDQETSTVTSETGTKVQTTRKAADKLRGFS
jgi:hypothetical protein